MVLECVKRVNELVKRMGQLEDNIAVETEYVKEVYSKASRAMSESQHYFLNGVQASPVTKSYLLTRKGIEVVGEDAIPISAFIDQALKFANYPKKKIEVLMVLAKHLEAMPMNLS
ncbi:MAG TPA: hypothetical protein VE594_08435 [Nitrososphaeraceae archaeon]|nr:hypothetical protein [Nitrososphaeraceae archaeon]